MPVTERQQAQYAVYQGAYSYKHFPQIAVFAECFHFATTASTAFFIS